MSPHHYAVTEGVAQYSSADRSRPYDGAFMKDL